jgi:hypothetical protein
MKSKLFGAIVAPVSIVGLTFALGLGVTAFGVGEQQQTQSDTEISALDVTTEVPVAPWCGWYVSGAGDAELVLEPDTSLAAPTEYTGVEIPLTATADENTAYVGEGPNLSEQPSADDCSWFTDGNKYGARYDVVADGIEFIAEALLTSDGLIFTPTADPSMDFSAIAGNALRITNVDIDACSAEGFSTDESAEIADTNLETTPWSVLTGSVTNNNFCQWSAKYDIKIPAGMSPLYGNVTYRWTGPTLTHTLVIPEDQVGPDPAP